MVPSRACGQGSAVPLASSGPGVGMAAEDPSVQYLQTQGGSLPWPCLTCEEAGWLGLHFVLLLPWHLGRWFQARDFLQTPLHLAFASVVASLSCGPGSP